MNIYIRETTRVMASRGVPVNVFTREHLDADEDPVDWGPGCRLIHVPAGPVGTTKGNLPRWLGTFVEGVLEHTRGNAKPYGGIVSHYWLSGLAANRLREHWGAPHAAGFHTLALAKPQAVGDERAGSEREAGEREVIAGADALLAATDDDRETLAADYGATPSRIVTAPPGVDTRRFRPLRRDECCRRLGLSESGRRLLFVGRTIPLKGIPVLLEALLRLPADVSAIIIGGSLGDGRRRSLVDTARRLGVSGRVRFEGSAPHEQLPLYFGAADICVVPFLLRKLRYGGAGGSRLCPSRRSIAGRRVGIGCRPWRERAACYSRVIRGTIGRFADVTQEQTLS